jgi:threonine-phosphate decarboxylase
MKHGGDLLSYENRFEGKIIDFSSNINPLGCPSGLKNMIIDNFDEITIYPDIQYRNLKKEISNYINCEDDQVVVGNGAVEIIDYFSTIFNRVIVVTPCFSEYIERPMINGKEVISLPMKKDFIIDINLIKSTLIEGDLLILGNPNNPTGKRIDKELLFDIYKMVIEKESFLLLDEAFFEFCEQDYDSIESFRESRNICVIRAATKFFSLPGIRLGYGFTTRSMAEKYNRISLPWSVNAFAVMATRVIFMDENYIKQSKEYILEQRTYLVDQLRDVGVISVYDTDCNFILIKLLKGNEDIIFDFLIERGILIRKASNFAGLDKSFIRIAIKSYEENKYIISCFLEYQRSIEV